ncbi:MAG: hypothetical protein Q4G30_08655 [Actinomycetaceae bacterium]|nr:hypothetical protein [Actinomycetaceae bacterium]
MSENVDPTLAARAADPSTSGAELQQLAGYHPELRPAIALNPAAYPDLLNWLGALGDADVDAALASRRAAEEAAATGGMAGAADETQVLDVGLEGTTVLPVSGGGYGVPAGPVYQGVPSGVPVGATGGGAPGAGVPPAAWGPPAGAMPAYPPYGVPAQNKSNTGLIVGMIVLGLILLGMLGGILLLLTSKDKNDGDAAGQGGPQTTQTSETPSETKSETQSPTPTPTRSTQEPGDEESEGPDRVVRAPAPSGAYSLDEFRTVSGATACIAADDYVSCTVQQFNAGAFSCNPSQELGQVYYSRSEDELYIGCAGRPETDTDTVLGYGEASEYDGFACTAADSGTTCWDTYSGKGFFISKQGAYGVNR